jgi:hypothetical protein
MCGLKEGNCVKLKKQIIFDVVAIHVVFLPTVLVLLVDRSLQNKMSFKEYNVMGGLCRCYAAMKPVIQVIL